MRKLQNQYFELLRLAEETTSRKEAIQLIHEAGRVMEEIRSMLHDSE